MNSNQQYLENILTNIGLTEGEFDTRLSGAINDVCKVAGVNYNTVVRELQDGELSAETRGEIKAGVAEFSALPTLSKAWKQPGLVQKYTGDERAFLEKTFSKPGALDEMFDHCEGYLGPSDPAVQVEQPSADVVPDVTEDASSVDNEKGGRPKLLTTAELGASTEEKAGATAVGLMQMLQSDPTFANTPMLGPLLNMLAPFAPAIDKIMGAFGIDLESVFKGAANPEGQKPAAENKNDANAPEAKENAPAASEPSGGAYVTKMHGDTPIRVPEGADKVTFEEGPNGGMTMTAHFAAAAEGPDVSEPENAVENNPVERNRAAANEVGSPELADTLEKSRDVNLTLSA